MDRWMGDFQFYSFSTVIQSYQDNGMVIIKDSVWWNPVDGGKDFSHRWNSNLEPPGPPAEHEFFPAHKCQNTNNYWHFNIYEWEK